MMTSNPSTLIKRSIAILLLSAIVPTVCAQTVRFHGAVTMGKLLTEQKADLEAKSGLKLEIVGNGSGRGLADLSGGLADVAMIGGSLKGVAEATNKEKPGSVDLTGMKEMPLSSIKLAIVSHPGVGVKSLTAGQARDVLSGKVSNWKDVGGADLAVKVVLPFTGDGARISVQESLMKEVEFAKGAVVRNSAKDIAGVIAQLPGSCSILTVKNVEGQMATVAVDQDLVMPMQFVTKGDASADVKKAIEAAKSAIK
jgi:phosphate transport system substrate-binding protein